MPEIGERITFVPTAYIAYCNGSEEAKERMKQSRVQGTVVQISEAHRWYRVRFTDAAGSTQHETFKM